MQRHGNFPGVVTSARLGAWLRTGQGQTHDPDEAEDLRRFPAVRVAASARRLRLLIGALVLANLAFWPFDRWLFQDLPGAAETLVRGRLALTGLGLAALLGLALPGRGRVAAGWLAGAAVCALSGFILGHLGGPGSTWFHFSYPFVLVGLAAWLPPGQRILLSILLGAAVGLGFFGADPAHRHHPLAGSALSNLVFVAVAAGLVGLWLDRLRLRVYLLLRERARHVAQLDERVAAQTRHIQALLDHAEHGREAERRALAGELHDELGQVLTALRCVLRVARDRHPEAAADLGQLALLLNHATRSLRVTLGRLRPPVLDDLGLAAALAWQGRQLTEAAGLALDLELPPEAELGAVPERVALGVFRVAQEALTNAVRHAGATRLALHLVTGPEGLTLTVRDDGVGFEVGSTSAATPGFGLAGMAERARALGGTLELRSALGGGTEIRLGLPLPATGTAEPEPEAAQREAA